MRSYQLRPIGRVHSCFKEKFGIPRQSGLAPSAPGSIEIFPPYHVKEAFDGLEECSHLWVQSFFHHNTSWAWKPRVKAPRLGGNRTHGVFATRSPNRPNAMGLSVVSLKGIRITKTAAWLDVAGLDLLDGTPVLDIKPYVPYADCVNEAYHRFAPEPPEMLPVAFSSRCIDFCEEYAERHNVDLEALIGQILAQNPQPAYHRGTDRHYAMRLLDLDIKWHYWVEGSQNGILVTEIVFAAPPATDPK